MPVIIGRFIESDGPLADSRLTGSYPETGLWDAPNSVSKALTKVNSLGSNSGPLIALPSPFAHFATGLARGAAQRVYVSGSVKRSCINHAVGNAQSSLVHGAFRRIGDLPKNLAG